MSDNAAFVTFTIWIAAVVLFAWWGHRIGARTGHPTRGLVLGLMLSWLGVLIAWLIGRNERPTTAA